MIEALTFAQLEQACGKAASLVCGVAFAEPAEFPPPPAADPMAAEASTIARRTADGFKAALGDREHSVLAWPWDHIATRVAWLAAREGPPAAPAVGERLTAIATAYAALHRDQLASVLDVWGQVTTGLAGPGAPATDLATLGERAHALFLAGAASA